MHRIRISLPYFEEFGWKPIVLAVDPEHAGRLVEPLLLETVPPGVHVRRVPALPTRITRKWGIGDVGLRSFYHLLRAGMELINEQKPDLLYFSTTVFWTLPLARMWNQHYDIPVLVDMQDPWVSNYYDSRPQDKRPPKYWLSKRLHGIVEPWTMRSVSGVIAVSRKYIDTLESRYNWLEDELCDTIPFGAAGVDYEVASRHRGKNRFFQRGDGFIHGVYAGALGQPFRKPACEAICLAVKEGLKRFPDAFSRLKLHFIGTDYAMGSRARGTIGPIAASLGIQAYVKEEPHWIPYFDVLNALSDADMLLVPGSDNPQYTASKIYPYILARKPLLALFHQDSSVVKVLEDTKAGEVLSFSSSSRPADLVQPLAERLQAMLARLPYEPPTDWAQFAKYSAREMARRQCALLDKVASHDGRGYSNGATIQ